ncbi:unnamed protein product [Eruca vesicaria subsp. sativa]|uniref:Uncharacterized protein n=1 Tax=Eruca vesicaria subsp. sativa TaxID=29727 RepID=A0ABC8LH61_ERUVS|nr:unnamed protein product [Eruca vesicaria subsp. sativa]
MPEYIYGNYFERLPVKILKKKEVKDEEEEVEILGLRELIDGGDDAVRGRVVHRNINIGSSSLVIRGIQARLIHPWGPKLLGASSL